MKQTIAAFDVLQNRLRPCEIDPEVPFYAKLLEGDPPEREPTFDHFDADGMPVVKYGYLAAEFEKNALRQFQATSRTELPEG